tara:strand:+ start:453 stop:1034 length:582 start_codon:yes stop_codon:yes gene_type:complete
MFNEHASPVDAISSQVASGGEISNKVKGGGAFTVQCFDKDGNLKWEAEKHNLVVNVGLQDMNAKYFTGSGYTAAWYIGLYGAASSNNPAAGDTAASHGGWTELTSYSQATRPQAVFGTATTADPSVISNTLSVAQFSINATVTVGGAFLISNNTKGGTSGVLFSAADFQSPGDRAVVSGDIINVTYQFSLDAA